jgi:large subunit ribosomal protein L15
MLILSQRKSQGEWEALFMMEHDLIRFPGARKRRKRIGRGDSAGQGSTAGRGMKGQKSRSGKPTRPGFEGGQNPLIKGLPTKRGFTNIFKVHFSLVKLGGLQSFPANADITPAVLFEKGLVRKGTLPVKILGDGQIDVPLNISAHKFTKSARQKIEGAGGTVVEIQR